MYWDILWSLFWEIGAIFTMLMFVLPPVVVGLGYVVYYVFLLAKALVVGHLRERSSEESALAWVNARCSR